MSSALRARLRTESESSRAPRLLTGPQSRSSSIDSELGRRGIAKSVVKDERMAIIKSTSGHITRAFISGDFSRVDGL